MIEELELWAGVECTVNRVQDTYFDQIDRSGHALRASDLALFADLKIKHLRMPIIWERVVGSSGQADWSWTDERLILAREYGIKPIIGFVHHGSGPRHTDLLDPGFPKKLADFASAFAERYPWIDRYTPINEPLTTARFSGLYGLWFPHKQDAENFVRILLHQCQGIALSMQAIRRIAPDAQLIQTEDLGKVFSTHLLKYQASFENERRWLSFDLLMGRIDAEHFLWDFLREQGLLEKELRAFVEAPCVPDIIGINHYVTSNRYIDERLERYPVHLHGGNGKHRYADIEAVRVGAEHIAGPRQLLMEAWDRYHKPIAITEVHIACTRDEQLRWLHEAWQSAEDLRKQKIDVRAVTAWSLLGSYDWDSLLTQANGHYESGVFDLRSPAPRPTALAALVQSLAEGQSFDHPVLDVPGWWHRPDRLLYPSMSLTLTSEVKDEKILHWPKSARRLLITGGKGTLASALAMVCECRGLPALVTSRQDLDIGDASSIRTFIEAHRPWAVINAAGSANVDQHEAEEHSCWTTHAQGPSILAEICASYGVPFLTFSSDLVFDGQTQRPYCESDPVNPLNIYGRCKVEAERQIRISHPEALIVRSAGFFGPWDERNFPIQTLRQLARGQVLKAAADIQVSPTYLPDLLNASLDLLIDGASGIWHLVNEGAISWYDFAYEIADRNALDTSLLRPTVGLEMGWRAKRPQFSALASQRAVLLPSLEEAMNRFVRECRMAFR